MGYSKIFKPERYESIAKVLEAVQTLHPGGRLTISGGSKEELGVIRYLVYDFLWHMGLKGKFRVKTLESSLLVLRLGFREEPKVRVEREQGELVEALIELWDTKAAEAQLKEWVSSGKISTEEGDELWKSVEKIMA
jgi:hypothetical protein